MARTIFVVALVTGASAFQHRILNDPVAVARVGVEPNVPGSPDLTHPWKGDLPFKAEHAQRQEWGKRLVAASTSDLVSEKTCGGFMSFGDFTWCAAAMPKEVDNVPVKRFWGPKLEDRNLESTRPAGHVDFVGISYGIRERDLWSEYLSNRYNVSTQLYDCYWKENRGPMGTSDFHASAMSCPTAEPCNKECPSWRKVDACYTAKYEPKKVCLDMKKPFLMTEDGRNLTFEPFSKALAGQKPLSVFLKMDIEGSEWQPLEWLLDNKDELAKIRTLDMEAHMQYLTEGGKQFGDTQIERKVKVMERLAKHFTVVGSTITNEHMKQKGRWERKFAQAEQGHMTQPIEEPRVYTKEALFLDRYSISFVSRKVLA